MKNDVVTVVAATLVKEGGDMLKDKVSALLVQRQIDKRADAFIKVHDILEGEERNFKKLGPDVKIYDETGKVTSESYSKARIDERAKVQKKIVSLTEAINKSLDEKEPNFDKLFQSAQGKVPDDTAGKPEGDSKPEGD